MQKNFFFKLVFGGVLKVSDENSRIRIHKPEARIAGSDWIHIKFSLTRRTGIKVGIHWKLDTI
jgi:hypothetical protein